MSDDDAKKKPKVTLSGLMKERGIPMPASDAPKTNAWAQATSRGEPVPDSRDLQRILDLPRRPVLDLKSERADALVTLINERYSNGVPAGQCGCKRIDPRRPCITSVLPIQAWTMFETGMAGGCVASIVVGGGKTILDLLLVHALGVQKALALVPSNLIDQIWVDYQLLAEHWKVPSVVIKTLGKQRSYPGQPTLYIYPYGHLSQPENSDYIDELKPEAIIADEADKLADLRGSATARRVMRYKVENPATKCCFLTGSLSDQKISEYSHLLVMALHENAPIPLDPQQVEKWGSAIDVSNMRAPAGALEQLCIDDEDVRRGYFRRLSETLGVITTSDSNVEKSDDEGTIAGTRVEVVVREREAPEVPDIILKALESARGYVRPDAMFGAPDNEELESPLELAKTVGEIISGVMYVWEFPPIDGVPQEDATIDEWYYYRRNWHKAVRKKVIEGAPFLDSPHLCEIAAARFHGDIPVDPNRPTWDCPDWPGWRDIRGRVKPKPAVVRIHDYLAEDAARWALEHRGIVWYTLVEFGQMVSEASGKLNGGVCLPLHGGGPKAPKRLRAEDGSRSIIASISSHGRGRDGLQRLFANQLVAQIPSSARRWEQLLGRLIRRGQKADAVTTWLYTHEPELRKAVDQALRRSEYVEDTLGMQQKLLTGWRALKGR